MPQTAEYFTGSFLVVSPRENGFTDKSVWPAFYDFKFFQCYLIEPRRFGNWYYVFTAFATIYLR